MKLTLTYNVTVPDSCPISLFGMMTRAMRMFLFPHFTQKTSHERSSLSLVKLVRHKAGEFHCDGFDGLDPEPVQDSDISFFRSTHARKGIMAGSLYEVISQDPPQAWPFWAQKELQNIANYRRWVTLQILNSDK